LVAGTSKERSFDFLQLIVFLLSLYVVVELAIEVILDFPDNIQEIFDYVDLGICIFFISVFFYELIKSESKKDFLKHNWFDLLSSIPFTSFMRILRVVRIIRIIRVMRLVKLLRGIKAIKPIVNFATKNKLRGVLVSYIIALVIVLFYCSLGFYMSEKDSNGMVKSYGDAIWWGFITVTSVGYGDVFPTTSEGRLFGIALTLCGMGLFSLVTAELSAKFLHYLKDKPQNKQAEKKEKET
jgi:voltage-gated potassium channel